MGGLKCGLTRRRVNRRDVRMDGRGGGENC